MYSRIVSYFTKDKIIEFSSNVIEWSFYSLIVALTFSISLVEIAAGIMMGFWVLKMILTRSTDFTRIPPFKFLYAYFIWVLLSCFNSSYFDESFRGIFKVIESGLIFVIPVLEFRNERIMKRVFKVIAVSSFLICLNGIFQYIFGTDILRGRELIHLDYLRRISSSFVHPNSFGIYLFVIATILMAFVISKSLSLKQRIWAIVPFIFCLLCLFLTRSRGSWMSFSLSAFILAFFRSRKTVLIIILIFAALLFIMPSSMRDSILDTADLETGTSWERVMLWKGTVNMIKVHPFLGFGINTYSKNFPDYKPEEYVDFRYSHNCYLQMASEIGVPGAVLFLTFLISVFVCILRGIRYMGEGFRKDMATGVFSALIGFSAGAAIDTHLYSLVLSVLFYSLLGFCYSLTLYAKK